MLGLIRKENYFQFYGRNDLRSHVAAMGIKMAVAFANIFMCAVENYFEPKQHQITRVETVHRRRILFMGPRTERKLTNSLNTLTDATQPRNLQLKFSDKE